MVMISRLLGDHLHDSSGRSAKTVDLKVDLSTGDYPTATSVLYRHAERGTLALPWDTIEVLDWDRGRLATADLEAGQPFSDEERARTVLLKEDVLDSLVLDLANRQATRANDLWLREQDGKLLLRGADLSPWAVIRRLGHGLLGHGVDRNLLDWKEVEFLRGDPHSAQAGGDYHRRVARLQAPEIAQLVDAMPYLHAAELLTLIPDPLAADALEVMAPDRQLQLFEELDEAQAAQLLALMAPDTAADLVGRLGPERAQHFLNALPKQQRERLLILLSYPPETAGGIMTNDIVAAPGRLTVAQARHALRDQLKRPDFIYYVYVIDAPDTGCLWGVVTLRDLVVAEDDQRLTEIMNPELVTIDPLESADEAARRVAEQHFAALPVVSRDGRLLGAITVDAAMTVLAPASWRVGAPKVFS